MPKMEKIGVASSLLDKGHADGSLAISVVFVFQCTLTTCTNHVLPMKYLKATIIEKGFEFDLDHESGIGLT